MFTYVRTCANSETYKGTKNTLWRVKFVSKIFTYVCLETQWCVTYESMYPTVITVV